MKRFVLSLLLLAVVGSLLKSTVPDMARYMRIRSM